jgi:hypothetical protein
MLPGVVYGVGSDVASAGRLYAGLTGRCYKDCANTLSGIKASSNDVIVCTTSQLTPHFMHTLYADDNSIGAPGLLFAPTPSGLEDVCRRQVERLKSGFPVTSQRVFIYPMLELTTIKRGEDLFIGGALNGDELLSILSSGVPLLALFSHSDGIDLRLSLHQHACPFVDSVLIGDDNLTPGCQVLGHCIRFPTKPTFSEARRRGAIVPVKVLRSQIGIISVCHGVKLSDGAIDPAYGLATALLRQASFAVIVTTWSRQMTPPDHSHLNSLINDLCSGAQTGQAVHSYNQSAVAKHLRSTLCILGDPAFSLARDLGFPPLPVTGLTLGESESPASTLGKARFLQELVAQSMRDSSEFDTVKGNNLLRLLAAGQQSWEDISQANWAPLDALLIDFLSAGPWLDERFACFREIQSTTTEVECPSCSAPAIQIRLCFPEYRVVPRDEIRCPCCDESRNMPITWKTCLELDGGRQGLIKVHHVPEGAQIVLGLYYPWGPALKVFLWPSIDNIWLPFRIPEQIPSLPLKCRVLVVRKLEIGVLGFNVRKLPSGFSLTQSKPYFSRAER